MQELEDAAKFYATNRLWQRSQADEIGLLRTPELSMEGRPRIGSSWRWLMHASARRLNQARNSDNVAKGSHSFISRKRRRNHSKGWYFLFDASDVGSA